MRTTLNLDDGLAREIRKLAARESRTLTSLVEEGLRLVLKRRRRRTDFRLQWPTRKGEGLPAVDISDRGSLYDAMEGRL